MGISPILVERIYETIAEINQQGTTILLVEQNANFALDVSKRGYVLETGKVVLSDDSGGAADQPRSPEGVPGHMTDLRAHRRQGAVAALRSGCCRAIAASYLSERKGYGIRLGLGLGMLTRGDRRRDHALPAGPRRLGLARAGARRAGQAGRLATLLLLTLAATAQASAGRRQQRLRRRRGRWLLRRRWRWRVLRGRRRWRVLRRQRGRRRRLDPHHHRDHRLLRDPSGAAEGPPARPGLREGVARAAARRAGRGSRGRGGRPGVRPGRGRGARPWSCTSPCRTRGPVTTATSCAGSSSPTSWPSGTAGSTTSPRAVSATSSTSRCSRSHQVGLVNRTADEDDRVVVLMQATLLDYVESEAGRLMRTDDAEGRREGDRARVLDPRQARRRVVPAVHRGPQGGRAQPDLGPRRDARPRRARPRRGGLRDRRRRTRSTTTASPIC